MVDIRPEQGLLRARWEEAPGQVLLGVLWLLLLAGLHVTLYGDRLHWWATTWPYNLLAALVISGAVAAAAWKSRRDKALRALRAQRERQRRHAIRELAPTVLLVFKRLTSALEQSGLLPADVEALPAHVSRIRQLLRDFADGTERSGMTAEEKQFLAAVTTPSARADWDHAAGLVQLLLARYGSAFPPDEQERLVALATHLGAVARVDDEVTGTSMASAGSNAAFDQLLDALDGLATSTILSLHLCAPE